MTRDEALRMAHDCLHKDNSFRSDPPYYWVADLLLDAYARGCDAAAPAEYESGRYGILVLDWLRVLALTITAGFVVWKLLSGFWIW